MGNIFKNIMVAGAIWNLLVPFYFATNPNCNFYQEMIVGEEYYIHNKQFPNNYTAGEICKWTAKSVEGTKVVMSCTNVTLPKSENCNGDRLVVSLVGDDKLRDDIRTYCGNGAFSLISEGSSLVIGLAATRSSPGGNFMCTLTAIKDSSSNVGIAAMQNLAACDCGWKQMTRIVGGQETGINEYPSMAGLISSEYNTLYCGASIIATRYAITAAHCVHNREASTLALLVGEHNIKTGSDTSYTALYRISAFEEYPDYNPTLETDDIAIVQTQNVITFSLYVGPICLPFRYSTYDFYGQQVTALGWGSSEFSGPTSDVLKKVNLNVISNYECAQEQTENINSAEMCTYSPGKDACQSDSGGPLLWMDTSTQRLHLVAVISHGLGCGTEIPGINTRVTSYLSWIVSRTNDASYCIR